MANAATLPTPGVLARDGEAMPQDRIGGKLGAQRRVDRANLALEPCQARPGLTLEQGRAVRGCGWRPGP
jgi:hypothetical protein